MGPGAGNRARPIIERHRNSEGVLIRTRLLGGLTQRLRCNKIRNRVAAINFRSGFPGRQLSERVLREDIRIREEPETTNMRYSRCGIGHEENDH